LNFYWAKKKKEPLNNQKNLPIILNQFFPFRRKLGVSEKKLPGFFFSKSCRAARIGSAKNKKKKTEKIRGPGGGVPTNTTNYNTRYRARTPTGLFFFLWPCPFGLPRFFKLPALLGFPSTEKKHAKSGDPGEEQKKKKKKKP